MFEIHIMKKQYCYSLNFKAHVLTLNETRTADCKLLCLYIYQLQTEVLHRVIAIQCKQRGHIELL